MCVSVEGTLRVLEHMKLSLARSHKRDVGIDLLRSITIHDEKGANPKCIYTRNFEELDAQGMTLSSTKGVISAITRSAFPP